MCATAVVTYPKTLGAGASVGLDDIASLSQHMKEFRTIVLHGLAWLDRFSKLEEIRRALESSERSEWPAPTDEKRNETLLAIYAHNGDRESLRSLAQTFLGAQKAGVSKDLQAFAKSILDWSSSTDV